MPDVFKKISFRNEKNSEGKEVIIMELREGGALDLAVARFELTEERAYDVIDSLTWRLQEMLENRIQSHSGILTRFQAETAEKALLEARRAAQETNRQLGICGTCGCPLYLSCVPQCFFALLYS
jgi:hypothetical protein